MFTLLEASGVSLEERIRRVEELDLEPIKFKLVHDSDPAWTIPQADRVEGEYKKFLVLVLKNRFTQRVQSVVPTKEVDEFWHAHILDTAKYAEDCEFCFGVFIHHFPYLGLRGPEDAQVLQDRFRESQEFYRTEFGSDFLPEGSGVCTTCGTSDCAPIPSCDDAPPPSISARTRPVLERV